MIVVKQSTSEVNTLASIKSLSHLKTSLLRCPLLSKRDHVHAEKQTVRDFSRVTRIQQQHGTNLVIKETIRKSLNVLVFGSGLCTKCSYQQKQTCFCWEEKLTQWSITATCNTVEGFWGTIGGSNLFQQCEGKAAPSLANIWPERTSHLCAFPSSHN